jgi:hypothetical protein
MAVMLLAIAVVLLLALGLLYLLRPELLIIPILMIFYLVNPGQRPHPPWEEMSDPLPRENSGL